MSVLKKLTLNILNGLFPQRLKKLTLKYCIKSTRLQNCLKKKPFQFEVGLSTFCNAADETLEHKFFSCPVSKNLCLELRNKLLLGIYCSQPIFLCTLNILVIPPGIGWVVEEKQLYPLISNHCLKVISGFIKRKSMWRDPVDVLISRPTAILRWDVL